METVEFQDFNKEKAAGLLAKGISPSQVALAIGVTPALISQYLTDPEFSSRISASRQEVLGKVIQREEAADKLEDALLEKIKVLVPGEFKIGNIMNAYKILNARKRFSDQSAGMDSQAGAATVTLNLPQQAINIFVQKDTNGQVIQVGTQTLVTLQAANLDTLAASHLTKENSNASSRQLPSPSTFDFG